MVLLPALAMAAGNPEIPLYEILDANGKLLGYLAGSTHHVPESFDTPTFLRQKLWSANFVAVEFFAPPSNRKAVVDVPWVMDDSTKALLGEYLANDPRAPAGKAPTVIPALRGSKAMDHGAKSLVELLTDNEAARAKAAEKREGKTPSDGRYSGLESKVIGITGKGPRSLEDAKDRATAYVGVTDADWNAYVRAKLKVWLGQLPASTDVLALPECKAVRDAMLTKRSETFARSMLGYLASSRSGYFVAVIGHNHLDQVIAALVAAGYRTRKVDAKTGPLDGSDAGGAPPPPGGGGVGTAAGAAPASGSAAGTLLPSVTHPDPDVQAVLDGMRAPAASAAANVQGVRQAALRKLNPDVPVGLAASAGAPVSLADAVAAGHVSAAVEGAGGVSSIRLTLTNSDSAAWRTVLIPAGMTFKSSSERSQNMAAR